MKHAHKLKKFNFQLSTLKSHFRKWWVHMKYKLFLLDRKMLCHPVLRYLYPAPGFARRFVIGMAAFVVLGTGLIMFLHPGRVDAAWYSDTWQFRKILTINHNKVSSNQTDFPVMINITDAGLASHAQSSGADILFTKADGSTKLSHEIEKYTSSNGSLIAWVKIPSLSSTADTNIYMYYGNASASDQQDATNVWDANYKQVWHMQETSGTTNADSTTNANDGTKVSATVPGPISDGKIDGAQNFKVASSAHVTGKDQNYFSPSVNNMTISVWARIPTNATAVSSGGCAGNGAYMVAKGAVNNYEWGLENENNTTICFSVWQLTGVSYAGLQYNQAMNDGLWHMYTMVIIPGTSVTLYVDNVQQAQVTSFAGSVGNGTAAVQAGERDGGSTFFDGDLDEFEISNTNRSTGWNTTEYNNQSDPGSFISKGTTQEVKGAPVLYWRFDEGTGPTAGDASADGNTGAVNQAIWKDNDSCLFGGKCLQFANNSGSVIFSDGFETGNFSKWLSHINVTADTSTTFDGSYSAKFTNDGSATSSSTLKTISTRSSVYIGAYGYWEPNTSSTSDLVGVHTVGGNVFTLYRQSTGKLCMWNDQTGTALCSARSIPYREWHRYDMFLSISATQGIMRAYVDGVLVPDLNITGLNTGTNSIDGGEVGMDTISRTFTGYADDFSMYTAPLTFVSKDYKNDTELDPGTASFTVSSWFKHPSSVSGTDTIIARSNGAVNGVGYKIYMNSSGRVCFGIDDDASSFPEDDACSTTTYIDSYWHHMEAVKNGTTSITLYIDGKQVDQDGTLSATGSLSGSNPTFYVGIDGDGASNPWDGFIDEVKYFDYAKTADQVKADYNAKGSVLGASTVFGAGDAANSVNQGLVGYWPMDDGVANLCASGVNHACDSSGNGNDGTWTGNTASASGKFGLGTAYDGVNDYTQVTGLTTSPSSLTIAAWVNVTAFDSGGSSFVSLGDHVSIAADTGSVYGQFYDGSNWNAINYFQNITGTGWKHIVYTFDNVGHIQRLYVDGVLVASGTNAQAISYSGLGSDTIFGRHGNSGTTNDLNGKLDDVRIYNRAISDREVRSLYDWAPVPVGWWKFDEHTGTSAYDSSGNGNTGVFVGNPKWVSGKYGGGVTLDGTNDWVTVASQSGLPRGDVPRSIESWFRTTDSTDRMNIGGFGNNANGQNFQIATDKDSGGSGDWVVYGWTAGEDWHTGVSNNIDTDGKWHYASATYDGTTTIFYLDGIQQASTTAYNWNTNPQRVVIGNEIDEAGQEFNGSIDDFRIYNYARTPKQIIQDMNGGHPAVGSPVGSAIGYWKFDEGYGTTAHNAGSVGTNLDGTLSGAILPTWRNEGEFGKALNFSGASAYVSMGNPTESQITSDLSLSAWVYLSSNTTNQDIIAKRGAAGQWGYRLWVDNAGIPKLDVVSPTNTMATVSANMTLAKNQWYHVVGTYNPSTALAIYVNGKLNNSNTSSIPSSIKNSTANLNVGGENAGASNLLNGSLDEVKLYSSTLNPDEVRVEYNLGKATVLGALSTNPDGTATNSAARYYCPPGNSETNCAAGSDPSPVGEWSYDEGSGTSLNDISGHGNNGTWSGSGSHWITGKVGKAGKYNGSDDTVSMGNMTAANGLTKFTISGWVRIDQFADWAPFMAKRTDNNNKINFTTGGPGEGGNDDIEASISNGTAVSGWTTGNILKQGVWNYWTTVYDGTLTGDTNRLKIYFNGVQQKVFFASGGLPATAPSTAANFLLGEENGVSKVNGAIDQVRFYNYARTPAQIAWDYNRGRPTSWWKFDECTGTTIHDVAWTASASALRVDGTWSGSAGTGSENTSAGTCNSGSSTEAWADGTTGKFNASLGFDGNDDVVSIPNDDKIWLNKGLVNGFTISTWVNATDAGEGSLGQIFNKGTNTFCRTKNPVGSHLDLECSLDLTTTDATITVGNAFDTGGWHNVVLSYDGANKITVWIDGKNRGNSNNGAGGTPAAENNSLFIGGNGTLTNNTAAFKGQIDQVMIFPYELTAPMIKVLYNENSSVRMGPVTGTP